jgi:hypothetical protein
MLKSAESVIDDIKNIIKQYETNTTKIERINQVIEDYESGGGS